MQSINFWITGELLLSNGEIGHKGRQQQHHDEKTAGAPFGEHIRFLDEAKSTGKEIRPIALSTVELCIAEK